MRNGGLPYFMLLEPIFSAVLYNALGIPITLGLLYPFFGVMLRRMIAGSAMSLNSDITLNNTSAIDPICGLTINHATAFLAACDGKAINRALRPTETGSGVTLEFFRQHCGIS